MHVTVKYHGIVGDMLQRKTEQITLGESATVEDLLIRVTSEDEHATAILKQTRAFIDGQQADRAAPLSEGAEVVFMRPIAGG